MQTNNVYSQIPHKQDNTADITEKIFTFVNTEGYDEELVLIEK